MPEINILQSYVFLWLTVFLAALAIEGLVPGLISIWFAAGAVAALCAAALGASLPVQAAVFLIVSGVCLVLTRPLAQKYINSRAQTTNADRVVGKIGIVTEEVNPVLGTGRITVQGQDWGAKPFQENQIIPAGTTVSVLSMAGVRLIVDPVKNAEVKEEAL